MINQGQEGNNRSVMPLHVLGHTRATLTMATSCSFTERYITTIREIENIRIRDVPDTNLPDTGFNRIALYQIPDSSKFKHLRVSLQLKFKQNIYVFPLI